MFERRSGSRRALTALLSALVSLIACAHAQAAPTVTEFSAGITAASGPDLITRGADGAMWFSEIQGDRIGRIAPNGTTTEYPSSGPGLTAGAQPSGIVTGPNGNLWFTESGAGKIGEIDPSTGQLVGEFPLPGGATSDPTAIVVGPDGALWFTEHGVSQVGRLDPALVSPGTSDGITEYQAYNGSSSDPNDQPTDLVLGPDHALWVTESAGRDVARVDPAMVNPGTGQGITFYELPSPDAESAGITVGPDSRLWVAEPNLDQIAQIDPSGVSEGTSAGIVSYPAGGSPAWISNAGDGALWLTDSADDELLRFDTSSHTSTVFGASQNVTGDVTGDAEDAAGNLWFTELNSNKVGKVATAPPPPPPAGPVPVSTHPPDVVGQAAAGKPLLCEHDTWNSPAFFSYKWFETVVVRGPLGSFSRQTTQVASGLTRSFVLPDYPPGATLYCSVTATNGNGSSAPALSAAVTVASTTPVLAPPAFGISSLPAISPASVSVANRLARTRAVTCSPGRWLHYPEKYRYQWFALPGQHSPIRSGVAVGTGVSLTLTQAEYAQWLVCRVTATNGAPGQGAAVSGAYYAGAPDFGVHVNAIEITQGVQTPELPTRSAANPSAYKVAYSGVNLPWQAAGAPPVTAELAENHATVVRVYVNTQLPLHGYGVPSLVLTAFRDGKELAPGPIEPDQPPPASAVKQGSLGAVPTTAQQDSPVGAYTFTLPQGSATADDWTTGDVEFVAQANPDANSTPPCSLSCEQRTLELETVHFNRVTAAFLDPLAIEDTSFPGASAFPAGYLTGFDQAWEETQATVPFAIFVPPYKATLNETGAVVAKNVAATTTAVIADVQSWADSNDNLSSHYPFGVTPAAASQAIGGTTNTSVSNPFGTTPRVLYGNAQPVSEAQENRPVTGLAHEFGHGVGLLHAGQTCGSNSNGQVGEPWAPLNDGAFDGVGLDTSYPSPYRIIPATTSANPIYDLMSYCGDQTNFPANYEADHWISVRNWNREVAFRAPAPTHSVNRRSANPFRYQTNPPASRAGGNTLAVIATYDESSRQAAILSVAPDTGPGTPAPAHPAYWFVGRDAGGHIVATAGAVISLVHLDGSPGAIVFEGKIPITGVREVDLLYNGAAIAEDHASAHAPAASLIFPKHGRRTIGGPRGADLRWRSHDADGGKLDVTVDYSPDGGNTWTTIYTGPDRGQVTLPSRLLSASDNARVRLYVSDGFNQTIVTSPRFIARGAPPAVSIELPRRRTRVSAGGALDLEGGAYADTGLRLTGRSLTWRAGRQIIGRGTRAVSVGLTAGRHRIVLSARDRAGRTGSSSISVVVIPAPPVVRLLRLPRRLSPRARSFTFRIASLAPDTLSIGRQRAVIGRNTRAVRVKIAPGRKALTFTLSLSSGRFLTAVPLRITR